MTRANYPAITTRATYNGIAASAAVEPRASKEASRGAILGGTTFDASVVGDTIYATTTDRAAASTTFVVRA